MKKDNIDLILAHVYDKDVVVPQMLSNKREKILKKAVDTLEAGGGGGAVSSVNGQTGDVVLDADDIMATNAQSVQQNLERIDLEVDGLTDDVADLNTGKLDASKQAVSDVGGLVLPNSAPAQQKIVSVTTGNAEQLLDVGTGLTIDGTTLKATGGGGSTVSVSLSGSSTNDVRYITINGTEYRFFHSNASSYYQHCTQFQSDDIKVAFNTYYVSNTVYTTMAAINSGLGGLKTSQPQNFRTPCVGKFKLDGEMCTAVMIYRKSITATAPTILGFKDSDFTAVTLDVPTTTTFTDFVSTTAFLLK